MPPNSLPSAPPPLQPLQYATPGQTIGPNLRLIAQRQRILMWCILAYLCVIPLQFILPPDYAWVAVIPGLAASVTAAVFIFMLSMAVYSQGTGILLGILTLVPCVGLIILLVVNSKATNLLRQHGAKVGLMGANLNQPVFAQWPR